MPRATPSARRDKFAAAALMGPIAHMNGEVHDGLTSPDADVRAQTARGIAITAFLIADAMLVEAAKH